MAVKNRPLNHSSHLSCNSGFLLMRWLVTFLFPLVQTRTEEHGHE
jgi:hypothetical protein